MSYCRWSTDNFNCDIYAYESNDGFVIHVASNRHVGEIPKVDMSFVKTNTDENVHKYIESSRKQSDFLSICKRQNIELPFAGESFVLPDLESFKEKMIELKNIGYSFPDHVLNIIDAEMEQIKI